MVTLPNVGLKAWNLVTDPYDHAQLADNWAKMDQHDHTLGKGVPITTGAIMDGAVTQAKMAVGALLPSFGSITADALADASKLGLTDSITARRGAVNIPAAETRSNVAYGTLTTPDRVTVTLPTNGLIAVAYQATAQESVNNAGRASIFLGANQTQVAINSGGSPFVAETAFSNSSGVNRDSPLATQPTGLSGGTGVAAYAGDVTTGQIISSIGSVGSGGPCYIFANQGTYDVSVQFKASSGSVTAKNRKLWVWTLGF